MNYWEIAQTLLTGFMLIFFVVAGILIKKHGAKTIKGVASESLKSTGLKVQYKLDYEDVDFSLNKRCPLVSGRCVEEDCMAWREDGEKFFCDEYRREFINYKRKK